MSELKNFVLLIITACLLASTTYALHITQFAKVAHMSSPITGVAFSPNSRYLLVKSEKEAGLFNLKNGSSASFGVTSANNHNLQFSDNSQQAVIPLSDETLGFFWVKPFVCLRKINVPAKMTVPPIINGSAQLSAVLLERLGKDITIAVFNHDNSQIATGHRNGKVKVWNVVKKRGHDE
jgi:WD40 repeat protein